MLIAAVKQRDVKSNTNATDTKVKLVPSLYLYMRYSKGTNGATEGPSITAIDGWWGGGGTSRVRGLSTL